MFTCQNIWKERYTSNCRFGDSNGLDKSKIVGSYICITFKTKNVISLFSHFLCWCIFRRYSSTEVKIFCFYTSATQESTNKAPKQTFLSFFKTHRNISGTLVHLHPFLHSLLRLFLSCCYCNILVMNSVPLFRTSE